MSQTKTSRRQYKCFTLWLNIPPDECPPHHYRLLGLKPFEEDAALIAQAVNEKLAIVRQFSTPDDAADSTAMAAYLQRIAQGMLNPAEKAAYDDELRSKLNASEVHAPEPLRGPHVMPTSMTAPMVSEQPQAQMVETTIPTLKPAVDIEAPPVERHPAGAPSSSYVWQWIAGAFALATLLLVACLLVVVLRLSTPVVPVPVPATPPETNASGAPTFAPVPGGANQQSIGRATTTPTQPVGPPVVAQPPQVEPVPEVVEAATKTQPDVPTAPVPRVANRPEKIVAIDPFANLTAFALPEVPTSQEQFGKSASAGRVHKSAIGKIDMELNSHAASLEGLYEFRVQPFDEGGSVIRRWLVTANPLAVRGEAATNTADNGDEVKLAWVSIDDNQQLRFEWYTGLSFSRADELCNSLLTLRHKSYSRVVPLRLGVHADQVVFPFEEKFIAYPIESVKQRPRDELLAVDLSSLNGLTTHVTIDPHVPLDLATTRQTRIYLGERREVELLVEFRRSEEENLQLLFRPRYLPGDGPRSRAKTLTPAELADDTRRTLRNVDLAVGKLYDASTRLPALRAEHAVVAAELNQLNVQDPDVRGRYNILQDRELDLRTEINALNRSGRALMNRIPKMYDGLGNLYRVARTANELQATGALTFQMFARAGDDRLVLFVADGRPQPAAVPLFVPPNPQVIGEWFTMVEEGMLIYRFRQDGSFDRILAGALQPMDVGNWQLHNNLVQVNAGGGGEQFTMAEDVKLVSGTKTLYRKMGN
jgi:hypothetical protein